MSNVLGINIHFGNDPKVMARMALNFRKAALISALDMIETAIEDLEGELEWCDDDEEMACLIGEIAVLNENAKEITDDLDELGNDTEEA